MGLLTLVPRPYLILGLVFALIASHGFAYFKGYKRAEDAQASQMIEVLKRERELLAAYDVVSRELVSALQVKQADTKIVYRTITKEIPNATTGRVCFNNDAASLWNDALKGSVSETPTGAAKASTGTYSDAEVLTNAAENFEQYTACRQQLNALIDWHEKVEAVDATK